MVGTISLSQALDDTDSLPAKQLPSKPHNKPKCQIHTGHTGLCIISCTISSLAQFTVLILQCKMFSCVNKALWFTTLDKEVSPYEKE